VRGTAHLLLTASVVAPVAYAITRDNVTTLGLTIGIALASTLPDLDHPASLASGLLNVRGGAARWAAQHRHRSGWTHSLLACLAWPALLALIACGGPTAAPWQWFPWIFGVLAAGGLLHLLEDMLPWCSRSGIPLFAPFSKRQWKLDQARRGRRFRPGSGATHMTQQASVEAVQELER
jgi:membrane-bound metal-dependent hydrolase YbcI (DUF457 family)